MTEQAKVPAIRFAGFTDPWEQRKLGEIADKVKKILMETSPRFLPTLQNTV